MTGHLSIGSPLEICRPVRRNGRLTHEWCPATIIANNDNELGVAFADGGRTHISLWGDHSMVWRIPEWKRNG